MAKKGSGKGWWIRIKRDSVYFTYVNAEGKERAKLLGPDPMTDIEIGKRIAELDLEKLVRKADPSQITFAEISEKFLEWGKNFGKKHYGRELAPSTKKLHTHIVEHYLNPEFGERVVLDIESAEIQRWLDALQIEPVTRYKIRVLMGTIFRFGKKYCYLTEAHNPIAEVQGCDTSDFEAKVLTAEQTLAILSHLKQPEFTLVFLIAATGLRQSEALALKWKDLDAKSCQIRVQNAWVYGDLQGTKSKTSKRVLPYHPLLQEVMDAWRTETMYAADNDWVFASVKSGGRVPRCGSIMVADHLRPAAAKARVIDETEKRFGFHNLRHSFGTALGSDGCDAKTLQKLMGHSSLKMTLHYLHPTADRALAAQGRLLERLIPRIPAVTGADSGSRAQTST